MSSHQVFSRIISKRSVVFTYEFLKSVVKLLHACATPAAGREMSVVVEGLEPSTAAHCCPVGLIDPQLLG